MFCSSCGKQLEDGVRFCKYCGAPTSRPEIPVPGAAGTLGIKHEDCATPEQPAMTTKSTKTKARMGVVLLVVLIAVIVIIAGVFLVRRMSGNANDSAAGQSYAIPELPDLLGYYTYADNGNYSSYFVDGQTLISAPENCRDLQVAEDGTMAMQINGGGVLIYRDGVQIGEIPRPVEYYYLCGSGEKLVYGTNRENSYLWDVSSDESTLVSDKYCSWGISYDGSTLDMGHYYSKNGQEPIWVINPVGVMSPDGKYIYCFGLWERTESNETEKYYASVSVIINGTSHTVFEGDLEPDGYYPYCIAYSKDYREILFSVHDEIYFYSVDDGFEAQHIDNIKDGQLLPLNRAVAYMNIFSWDNSSDVVSAWRSDWSYGGSTVPYRPQKTLKNGVFCLLKEQNGMKSVSIVRLVENTLIELIPNVTGNICLSDDEAKLWCVANGRLVFCDLAAESSHPVYCDTAYVRAYGENGEVSVSGERMDGWALVTAPIAVTSNGETVCFIGVDGSLWMCTPDTIHNPQLVTDGAFWVQCSADDMFYLMKGDSYEYFQGRACDLYQISANGEMNYQYSDVLDMYMTKANVYISVGKGSGSYPTDISCALYCSSDGGYRLICDDYFVDDISLCWWGKDY